MPIRPEARALYPKDWKAIADRIAERSDDPSTDPADAPAEARA